MWTDAQVTQENGRWIIYKITKCNDTTIFVRLFKCGQMLRLHKRMVVGLFTKYLNTMTQQ